MPGDDPGATSGEVISATRELECSQQHPNRNHHCVLALPWKLSVAERDRTGCHVNLVMTSWNAEACERRPPAGDRRPRLVGADRAGQGTDRNEIHADARIDASISSHRYNALLQSKLSRPRPPRRRPLRHQPLRGADGQLSELNGFNCTQGPSGAAQRLGLRPQGQVKRSELRVFLHRS